jgi:hypothetical protein
MGKFKPLVLTEFHAAGNILHKSMRSGLACLAMLGCCAASTVHAQQRQGPCQQITAACQGAGIALGKANEGAGLWLDCINPIMQAAAQRPVATKPLPQVDPQIVATCKATNETALLVACQLSAGRFEDIVSSFTPEMTSALPASKLAKHWNDVAAQMGPLRKLGTPWSVQSGAATAVPLQFEKGPGHLVVALDAGRIAGLWIKPGNPPL